MAAHCRDTSVDEPQAQRAKELVERGILLRFSVEAGDGVREPRDVPGHECVADDQFAL